MEMNKIYQIDCRKGINQIPKPNLIIADPPYDFESSGAGIVGMRETFNRISDAGIDKFNFNEYIPALLNLQEDKVNAYFFCNKKLLPTYLNEAIKRKLLYDILSMNKDAPIPTKNSSYLPEIEYVVFLRSPGAYWNGKLNYKLYFKSFRCLTNGVSNFHPTQKPIGIIRKYLQVSSKEGDLVLDPFMGSGTTAVACKQLNRNFIGFEINPEYCKIATERLQQTVLNDEGINFTQNPTDFALTSPLINVKRDSTESPKVATQPFA